MTLIELQEKLGEQIEVLSDKSTPFGVKKAQAEVAQTISSLAKQMINNADVMLRADKLVAEGKLKDSNIERLIK